MILYIWHALHRMPPKYMVVNLGEYHMWSSWSSYIFDTEKEAKLWIKKSIAKDKQDLCCIYKLLPRK